MEWVFGSPLIYGNQLTGPRFLAACVLSYYPNVSIQVAVGWVQPIDLRSSTASGAFSLFMGSVLFRKSLKALSSSGSSGARSNPPGLTETIFIVVVPARFHYLLL